MNDEEGADVVEVQEGIVELEGVDSMVVSDHSPIIAEETDYLVRAPL